MYGLLGMVKELTRHVTSDEILRTGLELLFSDLIVTIVSIFVWWETVPW